MLGSFETHFAMDWQGKDLFDVLFGAREFRGERETAEHGGLQVVGFGIMNARLNVALLEKLLEFVTAFAAYDVHVIDCLGPFAFHGSLNETFKALAIVRRNAP